MERIWAEEASFWKSEESHRRTIESALGWLTIADRMEPGIAELRAFAAEVSRDTDRVVVLGMGGSSLAPLVFSDSFPAAQGSPRLEVLDSTEPASVLAMLRGGTASRTMYVVSSKSGTTLEPNVFFDFFYAEAQKELGERAGERFVVVTDPGSALEKEAGKRKVRRVFPGDPRIGGRYSALSNFGIVPAALAGIDVAELLRRGREMAELCRRPGRDNPGLALGAAIASLALAGHDKLTFDVGAPIGRFGMWTEQLVAESTGKEGKGILPVEGEPLGGVSDYGRDRLFAALRRSTDEDGWRHVERLVSGGHPAARSSVDDALDLSAQMFLWEFATAVAGRVLGINPFDQPNVQEAKDRTNEILQGGGADRGSPGTGGGEVAELLASIRPGDYFAILAYVPSTEEHELLLSETRLRVRDSKRVATTVGFGPRFLHSTGQFHKGGPPSGVFLQITAEPREDVAIPGKPWSFGQVVAAQAAGDLAALRSRGRRAARVHLGPDVAAGLRELDRAVAGALETGGGRRA
ncbi:MAG TPA: glucose-6-phosphate isomerase [Thermoanaerobaculia bacterium]|nr:glucose-6-phosphate isomerase [Thermoanaerobaculia bacterium]